MAQKIYHIFTTQIYYVIVWRSEVWNVSMGLNQGVDKDYDF